MSRWVFVRSRKFVDISLFLGLCVLTLVLFLLPLPWQPGHPWDRVAHGVFYFLLTLVVLWRTGFRYPLLVVLVMCSLGAGIEYSQSLVPRRGMELLDFVANTGGIVAAVLLSWLFIATRRGERESGTSEDKKSSRGGLE